ncbi:hypothetical protein C7453_10793 [Gluconacetobacter liquefaciens]|uniref:Uncharacterized protein n=1 Tax=Gluconacetobacter liquefaciens TaxID=89584 RepID=A0A370FZH6_GLULI|nr:hypothetical protein C7453_10793 [Gluconacetobacter liquefaciens]
MAGPARPWTQIVRSSRNWRPFRPAEQPHGRGLILLFLVLFGGLVVITRFLTEDNDGFSAFWPANAVMLVALSPTMQPTC